MTREEMKKDQCAASRVAKKRERKSMLDLCLKARGRWNEGRLYLPFLCLMRHPPYLEAWFLY
jgi:hypothetical protein